MALREVLASFGIDIDDRALQEAATKIQKYESALKKLSADEKARLAAFQQAAAEQKKVQDAAQKDQEAYQAATKEAYDAAVKKAEADAKATKEARDRANAQSEVVRQLRAEFIVNAAKQVVSAFAGMVESSLQLAGSLNDTSDKLGVSTTELQQFQFAGRLVGVSADEMSQSLGFLNKNLGLAGAGGKEQAEAFSKMGITIKDNNGNLKSASEILPQVADKIAGMGSQAEKTATAVSIFGRSGANLLPLFKDGSKGIQEALDKFQELGLEIDKNFISQADDVGDQVETMHIQFDVLKTKLVAAALPALKQLSEVVLKLGAFFGKLLENTNASIILFAAFAGGALLALIAGFNSLAVAVGLSMSELLIIIGIFALVALVVEDIYTLFTGGDSVIGRFIDQLFGVGASKKFVEEVKKTVGELWDQFKELLPTLQQLWGDLKSLFGDGELGFTILKDAAKLFAGGLRATATEIKLLITFLKGLFAIWDAGFKAAGGVIDGIKAKFDAVVDTVKKVATAMSGIPGVGAIAANALGNGAPKVPPSTVAGGAGGTSNVSQQNQTTINVNGADQPQSVAAKVASSLSETVESKFRNAVNAVGSFF